MKFDNKFFLGKHDAELFPDNFSKNFMTHFKHFHPLKDTSFPQQSGLFSYVNYLPSPLGFADRAQRTVVLWELVPLCGQVLVTGLSITALLGGS